MEGARNDGVSSGSGLRLGTPRLSTRHLVRAAEQVVHRVRHLDHAPLLRLEVVRATYTKVRTSVTRTNPVADPVLTRL